ncbi:DsrE family protein [Sporanaerobium hydrogeniformans]|uniref:DsrE family protein n=1 Tax=Sporanaerobium hydrogeniformans TaxID=3072179 RepID=A0AC61D9F7_9FIRM|nr:DsrE family protein [Sporanaerobium hydrogeniformans]PHV69999.1 DsrE family protein [Sporanaerobium hydrogeniformans]
MKTGKKLVILWTTDNPITSEKMVMLYAINSAIGNRWDEVTVIIWGASAQLAATSPLIQDKIEAALHHGVKVVACKGVAQQLQVTDKLTWLGVEVKSVGDLLTDALQQGYSVLSV